MKTVAASVISIIAVAWLLTAAAPQQGINAVQWTGPNTQVVCSTNYFADTDMIVTLTTAGNPVQIAFNATANLSTNQGISLRPIIDGAVPDIVSTAHYVGNGDMMTLGFSRIYSVPKGTHTITVQSACGGGTVGIGLRWVSAYEMK